MSGKRLRRLVLDGSKRGTADRLGSTASLERMIGSGEMGGIGRRVGWRYKKTKVAAQLECRMRRSRRGFQRSVQ